MLDRRIVWAFVLALVACAVQAKDIRSVSFEDSVVVSLSGQRMGLAGVSAVERNYLSFYAIGLYVPKGNPDARALSHGTEACRIALQWLAPVSNETAKTYWTDEFKRSLGDPQALSRLDATIGRFIAAASPAARGDILILDYDPDSGLAMTRNGAVVARYPGVEFARAVLGIWFGDKAPSDRREELIGRAEPAAPKL